MITDLLMEWISCEEQSNYYQSIERRLTCPRNRLDVTNNLKSPRGNTMRIIIRNKYTYDTAHQNHNCIISVRIHILYV